MEFIKFLFLSSAVCAVHLPTAYEKNSVAIVLYEALRQQNFSHMQLEGELHRLHWKEKEI